MEPVIPPSIMHCYEYRINIESTSPATHCPPAMLELNMVTRKPRMCGGALSEMYIGVPPEAKPEVICYNIV